MDRTDEPLMDWERELLGHEQRVTVRLVATAHDGTVTTIDGINPHSFVWVHMNTESTSGWRNDAPLVLSVESDDDGPIHYIPNVQRWTTQSITEWVPSK